MSVAPDAFLHNQKSGPTSSQAYSPSPLEKYSNLVEIPSDRKKTNVTIICKITEKEHSSKYRAIWLASRKTVEQTLLEITVGHKMVTETSQNGYAKANLSLSNLTDFSQWLYRWEEERSGMSFALTRSLTRPPIADSDLEGLDPPNPVSVGVSGE